MQDALVDEGEVERLFRDEGRRLWAAVLGYTRDRQIAEDAVAESFAQLLRREREVRDPRAWVWTAAFRIARGELQRVGTLDHRVPEASSMDPLADTAILGVVAELPERQRAAILLFYYADRPVAEAARILGMSSSTFRVHLTRARRRLRTSLGSDPR